MCNKIRYNKCDILLLFISIYRFYRFFLNNSSRNPNYRTLISYESRAWDFIHFSNVPPRRRRRHAYSTSTAAAGYFPNTFSRIGHATHRRRRNPPPPPLETLAAGWVYSNAKVGV